VKQPGVVFEVRLHGRGGQGVVTAADLLALAAFEEGQHAQSFPSFGSERTGAPVVAYCRLSDRDIRLRTTVDHYLTRWVPMLHCECECCIHL